MNSFDKICLCMVEYLFEMNKKPPFMRPKMVFNLITKE